MAEYILQDKDKAAFINRMNKVLSQIGTGFGVDQSSFVDVPETEDGDKCIFIASSDIEEKVLDSLIDKNAFTYKVKKISVNEILREIKRELKEEIKYNESIINGKSYFSEFFGSTPSESEFIELIQRVPETVKSIEVPVATAKFNPSRKKYEGPITSQDKNDLIRIIKAMTIAFEEEEDPITNYVIRSYYGVSKNEATDRVYIQFETEGRRRFDASMSRGDYGPLD